MHVGDEDAAIGPPPEFGTVIRIDGPVPAPEATSRSANIGVVIVVASVVSVLGAVGTWFALSRAEAVAENARTAAPRAALSAAGVGAAPPALAPCPEGMVEIVGGSYFMGSDDLDQPVLRSARPAHNVDVAAYCIDVHEVTVAAYRTCSETGKCKRAHRDATWPQGKQNEEAWAADRRTYSALCNEAIEAHDQHPINCVSWHQAVAYCESRGGRLPSEQEWEFAARGSDGRVYSWGDANPDSERMNGCGKECVGWRATVGLSENPSLYEADDGFIGTAPVGSFPAGKTQAGLYDIAGNVFEWTQSEFLPFDEGERLAQVAKAGPDAPAKRVIRGGAFNSFMPAFADPALRFGQVEGAHPHAIGFRCAADPRTP